MMMQSRDNGDDVVGGDLLAKMSLSWGSYKATGSSASTSPPDTTGRFAARTWDVVSETGTTTS